MGARMAIAGALGRALPYQPASLYSNVRGELPAARGGGTIPGGEYREGYYRVLLDWTPDDLRTAVYTSSTGWLTLAGDLCLAMWGDDRIPACLSAKVMAVQGSPLTFEAAPAGRLRRRALKSLAAEEDWWDMMPESELELLRSWRHFLHVALGELVWTEPDPADPTGVAVIARIRNGRNVPRLKVWNPRNVRKDLDTGKWWVRTRDGTEVEARPGDGKWIILTSGGDRPWLRGPWRGVCELWCAKKYAREDWARQSEKYADGMIWIGAPEGSDEDERIKVAADFNKQGKRPVYCGPTGYTAEVLELTPSAWLTYQSQWEICNRSIAVAILYNDLGTESKKSAGTGAQLQGDVRDDIKKSDAAQDETELREQVLKCWALVNFGSADLAPWPCYNVEPAADMSALALTWANVAKAMQTADSAGFELDWNEIREATGFPVTGQREKQPVPAALGIDGAADPKAPSPGAVENDEAAAVRSDVLRLAASDGLALALHTVAEERGAPLSLGEGRALSRLPPERAAAALAALFTGRREAHARAVARSLIHGRARAERLAA